MPFQPRRCFLWTLSLLLFSSALQAAIVHGTVTDPLGLPVIHASVVLVQNGQILALALTRNDGTYQISSSASGRFYVLISAGNFKQITSLSFYAGAVDSHEEDVVLEPANVKEEIVTSTPRRGANQRRRQRAAQRRVPQSHRSARPLTPAARRLRCAPRRVRWHNLALHSRQ
jgi:Carboxypeptidase regulatory-like domain